MRTRLLAITVVLLGLSSTAHAHFQLVMPPNTNPAEIIGKGAPPCGPDTSLTSTPTPAQGGHPLMLKVSENVGHDGFYRVALALKSRSEIPVDNVVYDKANKILPPSGTPSGSSDHADSEATPVFPVLADNLFLHTAAAGTVVFMSNINLPNVNCDRCTLQVIEFMHPHGFNAGGGYFYHHCADLKITADPALPIFNPAGGDGGAPDATTPKDAASDSTTTGTAGTNGTGAAGTGATGAAGSNATGAAGSSAAGTNGAAGTIGNGAAGTGTSGAAGTNGAAGSSGAAGSAAGSRGGSSGGCSYAMDASHGVPSAGAVILLGLLVMRRRRARR